jgi:aminoglycoside/choline kinase family phosphotransferase
VLDGAIEALAAFQRCEWHDTPTPRFDAAFFRRELAIFEQLAVPAGRAAGRAAGAFLDDLASRVAAHPYRLVHRDFHVNNLFLRGADVAAVDYQDMRGGPDTYDVASLLRERGCAELLSSDDSWRARAARRLAWSGAWERRYLECAAQRGIKVVGTFLRLAAGGRPEYLAWLPRVRELARRAVVEIDGPGAMVELLSE